MVVVVIVVVVGGGGSGSVFDVVVGERGGCGIQSLKRSTFG